MEEGWEGGRWDHGGGDVLSRSQLAVGSLELMERVAHIQPIFCKLLFGSALILYTSLDKEHKTNIVGRG